MQNKQAIGEDDDDEEEEEEEEEMKRLFAIRFSFYE